jgi:hypothetical protein
MPPYRTISRLILFAVFMAGVAHVAALPPFEGFDEVAHWSYIQQIADEGRIPIYGQDPARRSRVSRITAGSPHPILGRQSRSQARRGSRKARA